MRLKGLGSVWLIDGNLQLRSSRTFLERSVVFTIHHPETKNETILGKFQTLCKIDEKLIRHKKLNGKSLITFIRRRYRIL